MSLKTKKPQSCGSMLGCSFKTSVILPCGDCKIQDLMLRRKLANHQISGLQYKCQRRKRFRSSGGISNTAQLCSCADVSEKYPISFIETTVQIYLIIFSKRFSIVMVNQSKLQSLLYQISQLSSKILILEAICSQMISSISLSIAC